MERSMVLARATCIGRRRVQPAFVCRQCRAIQISASPTTESLPPDHGFGSGTRGSADARFEILGRPSSLLSVTLSASQKLYTRRGTLVMAAGKVENAQSTLSVLSPLRRAFLGIPFLYQRITSTTPITALIATRSPTTTFSVLHLDGTTDWMVAQRNALLAWTGHTLALSPRANTRLGLAHWGATHLTGRGLAALSAPGNTYTLSLADGEEVVLHPSHVVAYPVARYPPQPFRLGGLGSTPGLAGLQVPAVVTASAGRLVPESVAAFVKTVRESAAYRWLAEVAFSLRTAAKRTIWGDRLFLHFRGPTTILVSSRGVRILDSLTRADVNEVADAPPGVVPVVAEGAESSTDLGKLNTKGKPAKAKETPSGLDAGVVKDGSATVEGKKEPNELVR